MKRPKSKQYLQWFVTAGWELRFQAVPQTKGPVKLTYELQNDAVGPNRRWDYANREKAVTDLLVQHSIIERDDRFIVKELTVKGIDEPVGVRVTITPYI
jgi:Holliday junction resolvase RusA-like endonuclease